MTSRFFGAGSGAASRSRYAPPPLTRRRGFTRAGADTAAALLARLRTLQRSRPAASSGVDCAICLGAVAAEERATLDCCTHQFCFECIAAWTEQASCCPLCKRAVSVLTRGAAKLAVQPRALRVDWLGDDAALFALEEETPCVVCGRDDDEASLLLCDGPDCDAACHVACAGLAAVPAGDWFCARCAPPEAAPAEEAQAQDAAAPQDAAAHQEDTKTLFERFRCARPGAR